MKDGDSAAPSLDPATLYRDPQRRATLVYVAFALLVASLVFTIWTGLEQISLLDRLDRGEAVTPAEFNAADDRLALSGLLYTASLPLVIIAFLTWIYRVAKNLQSLGVNTSFSPRGAVGWWFVPFVNFVRPFRIMKELMHESDRTEPTQGALLSTWWGLLILSNFVAPGLASLFEDSFDLGAARTELQRTAAADALDVVAALLAVVIVALITARQRKQAAARSIEGAEWPLADQFSDELRPIGTPWRPTSLIAVPVVVGLGSVILFGSPGSTSDLASTEVTGSLVGEVVDLEDLAEGDCLAERFTTNDDGDQVVAFRARVVPCTGSWELLVLNRYLSNSTGDFPGESAIQREAAERCDYASTFNIYPTSASWAAGDRLGLCFLEADAVFTPQPGECFGRTRTDLYVRESFLSCDQPHLGEISFVGQVPDEATYPGAETLDQLATDVCLDEFAAFVGVSYQNSTLIASWIVPTEAEWRLLDLRYVHCVIFDPEGALTTGSFAGSRR